MKAWIQRVSHASVTIDGERVAEIGASRIPVLLKPVAPPKLREAMLAAVLAARARRS